MAPLINNRRWAEVSSVLGVSEDICIWDLNGATANRDAGGKKLHENHRQNRPSWSMAEVEVEGSEESRPGVQIPAVSELMMVHTHARDTLMDVCFVQACSY